MKPLEGIRIVDMTTYAAGPAGTRILADLGADVIKIEPPKGEAFRVWGRTLSLPIDIDENPGMELDNANKRGIAVDVKTDEGKQILDRLIATADVFVSNYRAAALERLGLTYEILHQKYPKLVYAFLSGYGTKGPLAARPGFDFVAFWARGGILESTGQPGGDPGNVLPAGGDQLSGAMLAGAVTSALVGALRTGIGEKVEVSLYHSAIWYSSIHMLVSNYRENPRISRKVPDSPLVNVFQCKDERWIALAVFEHERYWPVISRVFGRSDWANDERYCTLKAAQANCKELIEEIDKIMITKTVDEWERIFAENDIASQRLFDPDEMNHDEQALANGYVKPFTFRNGNTINMATPPYIFESTRDSEIKMAPRVGENTFEVMTECGFSEEEIREFEEKKIIAVFQEEA